MRCMTRSKSAHVIGFNAARSPCDAVVTEAWLLQGACEDGIAAVDAAPDSTYALRRLGVAKLQLAVAHVEVIVC